MLFIPINNLTYYVSVKPVIYRLRYVTGFFILVILRELNPLSLKRDAHY